MFGWLAKLAFADARQTGPDPLMARSPSATMNDPPADRMILGLDLGEVKDYTALIALRMTRSRGPEGRLRRQYLCGLICRWKLRTGYEEIIGELGQIVANLSITPDLVIDGTGAGRAVVQMFRKAKLGFRRFVPVTITAGNSVKRAPDGYWHVGKVELVSSLLAAAESGRLQVVPTLSMAQTLVGELRTFRRKVNARTKNESFESLRSREHDDLVMAAALAVWHGENSGSELTADKFFV